MSETTLGGLCARFRAAGRAGTPYHKLIDGLTLAEADLATDEADMVSMAYDAGWTERIEAEWTVAWTTAIAHWDGHGTRGASMGEHEGEALRRVRIDPPWRDYQCARYLDGGFKVWTDDPRPRSSEAQTEDREASGTAVVASGDNATVVPISRETARGRDSEQWRALPIGVRSGLVSYFDRRRRPGDFLRAVLSNDLAQAVLQRTKDVDLDVLVRWLWAYAPPGSWGSPATVDQWLATPTVGGGGSTASDEPKGRGAKP